MPNKEIVPHTLSIGDYLKKRKNDGEQYFVIPEYQRPYSWTVSNCEKLWDDVEEYTKAENYKDSYFFGAVIISYQDDEKERVLIDGQQRTTTFFLLCKALLDKINSLLKQGHIASGSIDPQLKKTITGLKTFRKELMMKLYDCDELVDEIPDEDSDKPIYAGFSKLRNHSVTELEENKEDFDTIMKSYTYEDAEKGVHKAKYKKFDNKYSNCFRNYKFFHDEIEKQDLLFIYLFVKNLLQTCQLIEIGSWSDEQAVAMFNSLNSDGLPLTDADIISSKLYSHSEDTSAFAKSWKELIVKASCLEKDGICNIDSLLNQYMYYLRNKDAEPRSKTGEGIDASVPGVRRYFLDLSKGTLNEPDKFCADLAKIADTWSELKELPEVRLLLKLNGNSKLFLSNIFCLVGNGANKDDIIKYANLLLRLFALLEIDGSTYSNSKYKSFLIAESCNLLHDNKSIATIADEFDKHINSNWKREDMKKKILDYDGNILVYLNELLYATKKSWNFSNPSSFTSAEVEHIMPRADGKNSSIWTLAEMTSQDEFEDYVNKLGNKILLEKKINIKVSNRWFKDKLVSSEESYSDSAYPIANQLFSDYGPDGNVEPNKETWTKSDIDKATDKIADRLLDFIFGKASA